MKKRVCQKQLTLGKKIRDEAVRLKKQCGRRNDPCFAWARAAATVADYAIDEAIWGARHEMGGSCKKAVQLNRRARKTLNKAKQHA